MGDFGVADDDLETADDRAALHRFWRALIAGQAGEAAQLYRDDAELRLPQSDEVVCGRTAIADRGILGAGEELVKVNAIFGNGNIWISECEGRSQRTPMLVISVAFMDDGTIVNETRYWAPLHTGGKEAKKV